MEVVVEKPRFFVYLRNKHAKPTFSEVPKVDADEFSFLEKRIMIGKNAVNVVDSEIQLCDEVISPLIRYVIAGYKCFLLIFDSSDTLNSKTMGNSVSSKKQETFADVASKLLKNLFSLVNTETCEATIHVSFFNVLDDDMIVDVLHDSSKPHLVKTFEIPNQPFIETQDLVVKFITSDDDISEILLKRHSNWRNLKYSNCCHSVMYTNMLQKNIKSDSLEFLKVGSLTLVDLGHCTEKIFMEEIPVANEEDFKHDSDAPKTREVLLKRVLQGAIGGNARTSVVMNFDVISPTIKKEISTANLFLKLKDSLNSPEINEKLIIRSSLEEYSEEIKEIKSDINASKNKDGLLVCGRLHSSLKNFIIFGIENLKTHKQYHQNLIDIINCKKNRLEALNLSDYELREDLNKKEKSNEEISAELEKLRKTRNSLHEKISSSTSEIISLKNNSKACNMNTRLLKMELSLKTKMHMKATEDIEILNKELKVFYETTQAEFSSLQANLDSILICFKNHLENANYEKSEISSKLNDLNSNANSILNAWNDCTETLLSNLHVFIEIHNQNCSKLKDKMLSELMPLNSSQKEMVDILNKNRNAKIQMFLLFSQKIESSTQASIEILSEISSLLDEMLTKITKEIRAVEVTFSNSGKDFVKCINGLNSSLQNCRQYFPNLAKISAEINVKMSSQQKNFRKIDDEMKKIRNSLSCIREAYSLHNECAVDAWNQRQKDLFQMKQNTENISKHLAQFQEDLPKMYKDAYCSDIDYHSNTLQYSNENNKNMHCELKKLHHEMKCAVYSFNEENIKLVSKEEKEINKFQSILMENVTRNFDNTLLMIDVNSKYVSKELEKMQKTLASRCIDFKENISSNLPLCAEMAYFFTQPRCVSENIVNENEKCLQVISKVNATNVSEMDSNESFYSICDFNGQATSTPIKTKKKQDLSKEKEKLIKGIKKLIELQNVKYENKASELDKRNNESSASILKFKKWKKSQM